MNITLRQVEAFLAVARTLSFSRAAEQVHLSQPALSATIQRLEDEVGARLFDRDTRSVSLSIVGKEFVHIATDLLDHAGQSLHQIRDIVAGKRGRLVIAAVPAVAARLLPAILVRFKADHPQIELRIHDALANVCLEMVRTGEADVALAPTGAGADDLDQRLLYRAPVVVLCATQHPLASAPTVDWSDVIASDLIVRSYDSSLRQLLEAQYLQHGKVLSPAFEVEHIGTVVGLIKAGLGIGVLPAQILHAINMDGLVCRHFDAKPRPHWAISISTARNRASAPTVEPFVRMCVEYVERYRLEEDFPAGGG